MYTWIILPEQFLYRVIQGTTDFVFTINSSLVGYTYDTFWDLCFWWNFLICSSSVLVTVNQTIHLLVKSCYIIMKKWFCYLIISFENMTRQSMVICALCPFFSWQQIISKWHILLVCVLIFPKLGGATHCRNNWSLTPSNTFTICTLLTCKTFTENGFLFSAT